VTGRQKYVGNQMIILDTDSDVINKIYWFFFVVPPWIMIFTQFIHQQMHIY